MARLLSYVPLFGLHACAWRVRIGSHELKIENSRSSGSNNGSGKNSSSNNRSSKGSNNQRDKDDEDNYDYLWR